MIVNPGRLVGPEMHSRWPLVSNALGRLITHTPPDARWGMRWASPHAVLAAAVPCAFAMPPLMAVPSRTATRRTARRPAVIAALVQRHEAGYGPRDSWRGSPGRPLMPPEEP